MALVSAHPLSANASGIRTAPPLSIYQPEGDQQRTQINHQIQSNSIKFNQIQLNSIK